MSRRNEVKKNTVNPQTRSKKVGFEPNLTQICRFGGLLLSPFVRCQYISLSILEQQKLPDKIYLLKKKYQEKRKEGRKEGKLQNASFCQVDRIVCSVRHKWLG